jgi:hypothetical protein
VAKVTLAFHEVERGFPAIFPSSAVPTAQTLKELARLSGWRTLRVIHAWGDEVDLAALLPAQLPLLESLEEVGLSTLERCGALSWPVKRMTVIGTELRGRITGLPALEALEWSPRPSQVFSKMIYRPPPDFGTQLAKLAPSGLLERLRRLVVRVNQVSLRELLEACVRLPPTLRQVEVQAWPYPHVSLLRTDRGVELTAHSDGSDAEALIQELQALPVATVSKVDVALVGSPLLSAPARTTVERRLREVLTRFPRSALSARPSP